METCLGYSIQCPDGKFRHFPYHSTGDAAFDARCYSQVPEACSKHVEDKSCPGGVHTVEPVTFDHAGI